MGLEIEAKMKVKDFSALRRRLKAAGAGAAGERLETNIYFDTPAGALRSDDKGLRVRTYRDGKTGRAEHVVTFKGPRQSGALKSRPEFEFSIDDPEALIEVFKQIGYPVTLSFQKRRRSFKLANCKVELDELPHLGKFVEIEGPSEKQVMKVRQMLGLSALPLISAGYASMLADYLAARKTQSRNIEFG
jgi:adenylate cyclase class 2